MYVQVLEVVLAGAPNGEASTRARRSASRWNGDTQIPAQVAAGERCLVLEDVIQHSGNDHFTTVTPRARAEIYDVVGGSNGFFIVLDYDDRVAEIPEAGERAQQALVVPGMQADRGLVQYVEDAHEPTADLSSQTNPLRLSARKRRGRAPQCEIAKTYVHEETESIRDLLENGPCDFRVETTASRRSAVPRGPQRYPLEELQHRLHRVVQHITDTPSMDGDAQALPFEPAAVAHRARLFGHVLAELRPDGVGRRFLVAPFHVPNNPFPLGPVGALRTSTPVLEGELPARDAVQQGLDDPGGVAAPWLRRIEVEGFGQRRKHVLSQVARRLTPRQHHTFENGDGRIGQYELCAHRAPRPQPTAALARAKR